MEEDVHAKDTGNHGEEYVAPTSDAHKSKSNSNTDNKDNSDSSTDSEVPSLVSSQHAAANGSVNYGNKTEGKSNITTNTAEQRKPQSNNKATLPHVKRTLAELEREASDEDDIHTNRTSTIQVASNNSGVRNVKSIPGRARVTIASEDKAVEVRLKTTSANTSSNSNSNTNSRSNSPSTYSDITKKHQPKKHAESTSNQATVKSHHTQNSSKTNNKMPSKPVKYEQTRLDTHLVDRRSLLSSPHDMTSSPATVSATSHNHQHKKTSHQQHQQDKSPAKQKLKTERSPRSRRSRLFRSFRGVSSSPKRQSESTLKRDIGDNRSFRSSSDDEYDFGSNYDDDEGKDFLRDQYNHDPHNLLDRFVVPQIELYEVALAEICQGKKKSCWFWYVLPTAPFIVDGVERGSHMNRRYCLRTDAAAHAFLDDNVRRGVSLKKNYTLMLEAILGQIRGGNTFRQLFGPLDDVKALSSFRLFERIATERDDMYMAKLCAKLIYKGEKEEAKRRASQKNTAFYVW